MPHKKHKIYTRGAFFILNLNKKIKTHLKDAQKLVEICRAEREINEKSINFFRVE